MKTAPSCGITQSSTEAKIRPRKSNRNDNGRRADSCALLPEDTVIALVTFNNNIVEMRGKSGKSNFARTQYGTEYKANPIRTKPFTPAQLAQQERMKKAAAAFAALNAGQNAAWQAYAKTQLVTKKSGAKVHPSAYSAYVALYTKFIQVNPTTTPPVNPPAASFSGDTITVSVTAAAGKVTFTANAKNSANVTTELLLQPLKNAYRKPQASGYVTYGFFTFAVGALSTIVNVPAGAYAAAIRFVNSATGQEVSRVTLGVVVA